MADLFSGGAVGAVLGEMAKQALQTIKKGLEFRPTLERNIETLNSLAPLVEEMKKYNEVLDRPRKEIERLQTHITEGKELVKKSKKLSRWRFLSFPQYQSKLQKKDEALKRQLSVNVQAENKRDLMEVLSSVRQILEILLSKENLGGQNQIRGFSGAPEEPECMGMDEPLNKLKIELLKDGVSVLVLTGLGGSGKSTLAKKICWEPQIKGKFGGNIFFVTVSKTPNLKNIVQTLFEHCGCQVPEFQSDEDATNRLGVLLRHVGRSPILLVLDDVWPNSEGLVEKFKFQMSDYKILVTSRVAFPRFGTPCQLDPLGHDYAVSLFRHFAQLNASSSYMPDENLVHEIVRGCKGSPLALEVIAGSLCKRPFEVWHNMKEHLQSQSILESNSTLLSLLQQSLDILEDKFSINEKACFMDLGLFLEDQRIPVAVLIDMWAELHSLDEDGRNAMTIVHDLTTRNLINVMVTRKVATETDMYYNNHYVMLHDLLRELAIHQSKGEPFEQRERLIIDLNGDNRPDWWVGENQQGIIGYMFSFIPRMLVKQKQLRVAARILSISTDETFTSDWCDMEPDEAEVLVLNLRSSEYTLPEFTKKMSKLKVLTVTNYGYHRPQLTKFELLGFLTNLKRIRLEKVSVPCLCILKNLRKLSLHMCNTRQAFESCSIQISDAMPNLVEMSIDYCNDLVKLPEGIFNITPLKKLSITNCHKLHALPQDIAKLENLEVLRLCSCSDLEDMPTFVGGLNKLRCLDISDCASLRKLPDDIGDLQKLEKLFMKGCSSLSNLPYSVINFAHLEHEMHVICDEERAALWEEFLSIPNLKIKMPKEKGSVLLGCREETAKQALQTIKKGQEFRSTLERNTETLNSCAPVVEEMTKHNEMLDRPREEIERLQSHITEGKELVKKSNNLSRSSEEEYQSKLQKKDVQAESRGDLMEVLSHERQDLKILLSKENQISGLNTGDLMEGLSHERQIFEMGETAKQALQTVKKGIEFRPTLERDTETLMVEDMTKHNEMLDRPIEEIERLQSHITEGKELVKKSNNLGRSSEEEYQSKLQEKDVQAENRGDLMEVLSSVRQNLEILPERKRDLLSDSASFASHDHDHDTEIETMASAMVEVDEVDEESNIHNISWQKGKILGVPRSFKVHGKMCTELMKLVDSILRIFPDIEEARPRCSSGIESLCLLNNAIDQAKLLLQHCSECSKLYLAVTGDTVLSRFQKATRSLEQSLIPIQGMVPVMLAVEVSRMIDDLECATFVLDSAEEEAGRVITKLLQQDTSTTESVDDSEVKALQFAAPRLNITSAKAILIEKRSIKKLLDKVGPNDQEKKMILRYLMYLLKKHGNFMVGEQMEKVYSCREEPIAMENSHCDSLRSHRVESDPSLNCGQYRVTPPEEYKCPISSKLMYDPVVIASGVTYERMWIKKWFDEGKTICPKTKEELPHMALTPNVVMKDLISKWCKINGVSIPDPSWQEEKVHSWETSNTSIKSFGSYFNDLSLPVDLTNMSLGSLDSSFSSDVSRVKSTTHSSNLIKTGENSHKHRAREEIRDTDLMLLPNLHDFQWDSQCKVIEDMKDHLKSNSQAMISVSAEDFVEPLVRFLSNANDLQDVKALRAGTQLLLEFVNNCRNGMANLSEDTFIKLASLLESEVIGEVLAIMEELSGDGNSKAKIAASSALTSVLKSLDSDNKGFQQQAIRIMYNLSFNTEVCLHMVSLNCIPKLLPFFKDRAVLRYCIYILKNICDTEEGRNSIAETKGCLSSVAEILETGSNEEQEHALAVLVSLCSQNVDYCKLVMGEDIITTLFFISQNGNDKGKESALELIHLLRDTKYVENEDCSSEPITNYNSVDSNSRHEENKSSKRKPFLKKLSLFSKSSSHA